MSTTVNYSISFDRPYTHYCRVKMTAEGLKGDKAVLALPVWTPGSYLVREFARHVDDVSAFDSSGSNLKIEKVNKNTWEAEIGGDASLTVNYRVYCNELTVRTSEINSDHAFLNGANIFLSLTGEEEREHVVELNPYKDWKKISTGLKRVKENVYSAKDYDILVDSPIEIGNQEILEFEVDSKKHFISLAGRGNYEGEKLVSDFKKIVETERDMFDGLPYESFTFLINLVEKGGGGLEHLNSFAVQFPRWSFTDKKKYEDFLALVSHEFFHVWNVKRVRPAGLGPFDYHNEVYTKSHWVTEGWTSFFDNLILIRAGLISDERYFEFLDVEVNDVMYYTGRFHQSLEQSSFDNWIKFYRRHENTRNDQVSYYKKGALAAMMLDIEIISSTDCEKCLDDVLRVLYEDYQNDPAAGYTDERVKEVCEDIAGKNLDDFWGKYVSGVDELPLNEYLNLAGLEVVNKNDEGTVRLDVTLKPGTENFKISEVYAGGSAYESGININDEIIAIDDIRVNSRNMKKVLKNFKTGDTLTAFINRGVLIPATTSSPCAFIGYSP